MRDGELVLNCDYYGEVMFKMSEGKAVKIGVFCEACKKECIHNVGGDSYLLLKIKEFDKDNA